ncbi:MAG: hypothetical protein PHG14_10190 [Desulfobacter postgatei]|uniref:hypothetical protein n=1 Tax=Desulfobacter postgatei TaxID=2293 RepID=UPI0023F48B83|nr:hypothetical protein [Desulfobacter postgatei]MDD4274081.1 hypothetical protein [Desulfobacter postgatei]
MSRSIIFSIQVPKRSCPWGTGPDIVDDLTEHADRFKAGFVVGIGGISYWRVYNLRLEIALTWPPC